MSERHPALLSHDQIMGMGWDPNPYEVADAAVRKVVEWLSANGQPAPPFGCGWRVDADAWRTLRVAVGLALAGGQLNPVEEPLPATEEDGGE